MRPNLEDAHQVAARPTRTARVPFALIAHAHAGIDAAWDLERLLGRHKVTTLAARRALVDVNVAAPAAGPAGLLDREEAGRLQHLAMTAALLAALRPRA